MIDNWQKFVLIYFAGDLAEHVIVNKNPEGQGNGIVDVGWVRDDARKRSEVELLAEDNHGVLTVEDRDEEQREPNGKLYAVVDSVFD